MAGDKPIKEKKVINIWGEEEYKKDPRYNHPSADKTHHNYNSKHFQMFGENKIAFIKELQSYHPELNGLIIQKHGHEDADTIFHMALAEVSAFFEIILDGDYNDEEIENLCGILLQKLVQSRTPLLFDAPVRSTKEVGVIVTTDKKIH